MHASECLSLVIGIFRKRRRRRRRLYGTGTTQNTEHGGERSDRIFRKDLTPKVDQSAKANDAPPASWCVTIDLVTGSFSVKSYSARPQRGPPAA
jgi:hypothetical protein